MYSKIHTLQAFRKVEPERDEFNRIVSNGGAWEDVCMCRCDDNNDKHFKDDNGEVYTPQYHVVCEGYADISSGDLIRCLHDGLVRGEGKVFNVKHLNYLKYTELWV